MQRHHNWAPTLFCDVQQATSKISLAPVSWQGIVIVTDLRACDLEQVAHDADLCKPPTLPCLRRKAVKTRVGRLAFVPICSSRRLQAFSKTVLVRKVLSRFSSSIFLISVPDGLKMSRLASGSAATKASCSPICRLFDVRFYKKILAKQATHENVSRLRLRRNTLRSMTR